MRLKMKTLTLTTIVNWMYCRERQLTLDYKHQNKKKSLFYDSEF